MDSPHNQYSEEMVLSIRSLHKSYGPLEVLNGINLDVSRGETVVICGPSGSGKSTMLRCINRLEESSSGEILVDGTSVLGCQRRQLIEVRKKIGFVFQQFHLYPHLTALSNIALAPIKVRRTDRNDAHESARALLKRVGLAEKADNYPAQLSGGQQQRVAIARALAMKPSLLLFDEPTSALDPETTGEVLDVMYDLAAEGLTMLVVTHEVQFAREAAERIVFIEDSKIVMDAEPHEFFAESTPSRVAQFFRTLR